MKNTTLKQFFNNIIVKNTLILIICSLFVKGLGLINRIILTRMMGNVGISLYILSLPSISLFMSLAGFSLNIAMSKIVSENNVKKQYSNKYLLKKAIQISLLTSFIMIMIIFTIISPLTTKWLKQENSFYPILSCVTFLPLVAVNNVIRGYLNGHNKINISAYISVFEQTTRIIISIALIIICSPYGLIVTVTALVLSMGIGELLSLILSLFILRKFKINDNTSNKNPTKEIISIAVPTTLSRLISNFSIFLEPIIYTLALTNLSYNNKDIMYLYGEVNAYAIPLITMFTFIASSLATSIIPIIAKNHVNNNNEYNNALIKKAIRLSLYPGILISIILTFFSDELMQLIYHTTIGASYVKAFAFLFLFYYIQPPLVATLQALGESKKIFTISLIANIIKLTLIFSLVYVNQIKHQSLILAMIISSTIATLACYYAVKNKTGFKLTFNDSMKFIITSLISTLSALLFKQIFTNFIVAILAISISFILSITTLSDK